MRSWVLVASAALAACGGPQRSSGDSAARPATPEEAAAIQEVVFDGQRAGSIRHDLDAYMAQWTDDARIVAARGEQPGPHEYTLDRAQIEASRGLSYQGPSFVLAVEYKDVSATVAGDEATLSVRTHVRYREGSETYGEQFRLRLTPQGWRVFENRYWPISRTVGGETTSYDADYFAAADQRVDAARAAGDRYETAVALLDAWRHAEALELLRELTEQQDVEAYDWVLRGHAAVATGAAQEAERAFAAALALDPSVPVPDYAR